MKKQYAKLECIENNEPITQEKHYEFIYHLQSALLLSLRELEILNVMQYRYALEKLKTQRQKRAKCILEKEKIL